VPASPALAASPAPARASHAAAVAAHDGQVHDTQAHDESAQSEQVLGDVLGLGYDQIIRIAGSQLQIVEPDDRGGAILRAFYVGSAASHLATIGTTIFVGSVYGPDSGSMVGSKVQRFTAAGELINERAFPAKVAITSLDASVRDGREFLEIGFGQNGTRTVLADVIGISDAP
jgi:hypothetical protein